MGEICSDIGAWVQFASMEGFRNIIIEGHSAGAVAIARFLLIGVSRENIRAAVFASPTDMIGLQLDAHGERFKDLLSLATQRVAIGEGRSLMLEDTLDGYSFDALTYLDLFNPGGPSDIFNFRSPERLRHLQALQMPCLFFFGGGHEVCSVPVADALAALGNQIGASLPVSTTLVSGAPHSYRGYESQIVSIVFDWISQLDVCRNDEAER
jgi:acetyl esterase/lipase